MAWKPEHRKPRRGSEHIPEKIRRKVFKHYPYCWLRIDGVCTYRSEQVHHVLEDTDGGTNDLDNLVGVCKACHTYYSARDSQKRAVKAAWDWKRRPEKHPGVLD